MMGFTWQLGPLATPLGSLYLAGTPRGLARVQWNEPVVWHPVPPAPAWANAWQMALEAYFRGKCPILDGPMDLSGVSLFAQAVYRAIRTIPYGETRTYGEVAAVLGKPAAARAVGRALACNPIPIVIPCHRVVAAGGDLRGYSAPGGLQAKAWLLDWERRHCLGRRADVR